MARSDNLRLARKNKIDEFYTRLEDIEKELIFYKTDFEGKTVFCNCDDPFESNFFKYFAANFNFLKLKKLIATCYDDSPIAFTQTALFSELEYSFKNTVRRAYKIEINKVEDYNNDGAVDLSDVRLLLKSDKNSLSLLKGNGDFRSEECIELLKEADIVVTNPPFSLFREYVGQLVQYEKRFVIIGSQNCVAYKDIFPLIVQNKLWLGYNWGAQIFRVPMSLERNNTFVQDGVKYAKFGNMCWFTNLDTKKRQEDLILYKTYSFEEYPTYCNFDAINVNKVADIPCDYDGMMGVPITFLCNYNPMQFEIIGLGSGYLGQSIGISGIPKEHKKKMKGHSAAGDLYYMRDNLPVVPYGRILIRRKTCKLN